MLVCVCIIKNVTDLYGYGLFTIIRYNIIIKKIKSEIIKYTNIIC